MRHLLFGLALLSAQAYGQVVYQEATNSPMGAPAPRQYLLNPPPATGRSLTQPGAGLPFKTWQELLVKSALNTEQGETIMAGRVRGKTGWAAGGQCSVPLLEMALPEHFDESMVLKVPPHPDDKMAITPPPDCPLHTAQTNPAKRK